MLPRGPTRGRGSDGTPLAVSAAKGHGKGHDKSGDHGGGHGGCKGGGKGGKSAGKSAGKSGGRSAGEETSRGDILGGRITGVHVPTLNGAPATDRSGPHFALDSIASTEPKKASRLSEPQKASRLPPCVSKGAFPPCVSKSAFPEKFSAEITFSGKSSLFVIAKDVFIPSHAYDHLQPVYDGDTLTGFRERHVKEGSKCKWRAVLITGVEHGSDKRMGRQELWLEGGADLLTAITPLLLRGSPTPPRARRARSAADPARQPPSTADPARQTCARASRASALLLAVTPPLPPRTPASEGGYRSQASFGKHPSLGKPAPFCSRSSKPTYSPKQTQLQAAHAAGAPMPIGVPVEAVCSGAGGMRTLELPMLPSNAAPSLDDADRDRVEARFAERALQLASRALAEAIDSDGFP